MYSQIPTSLDVDFEWRNESTQKPPKAALFVRECNADVALKHAYEHTVLVWQGDFHNVKQVLAAMKKRLRGKGKGKCEADIQAVFHRHRMQQAQQSRVLNMLAVAIQPDLVLDLPRAPDVREALLDVYGEVNAKPFLLPLNQLLGFIGAHEWHKKGVEIAALGAKVHVPFGVFSPLRGEYLSLVMEAPLPARCDTAFDIGTGSGILAGLLAKRGVPHIIGTDTNPQAIRCAEANLARWQCSLQVQIQACDLFPKGCADLIICNPPWLPAKPTSAIEAALYDPDSAMLKAFLNGVRAHLNADGEAWLIISDLAEHLHLRAPDFLQQCFQTASLVVVGVHSAKPRHGKAYDMSDPLAFARSQETTFLYRLKAV